VAGAFLFNSCCGDSRADRTEHCRRCRIDYAPHDLPDAANRRQRGRFRRRRPPQRTGAGDDEADAADKQQRADREEREPYSHRKFAASSTLPVPA
jgi:hypothetical protein